MSVLDKHKVKAQSMKSQDSGGRIPGIVRHKTNDFLGPVNAVRANLQQTLLTSTVPWSLFRRSTCETASARLRQLEVERTWKQ